PFGPIATSNCALATSIPTNRFASAITAPHHAACPALQSGISFPYNRSGLSAVKARRPSLLDGVLAPRLHRPAAPRLSMVLLHPLHTRLRKKDRGLIVTACRVGADRRWRRKRGCVGRTSSKAECAVTYRRGDECPRIIRCGRSG